jgi:hypothetical protein
MTPDEWDKVIAGLCIFGLLVYFTALLFGGF